MPSLSNIAAQNLQSLIADGTYAVGKTLPGQRELAETLGISRACLREAVSMLEALGLVRSHAGKGVFVTAGTERKSDDIPPNPNGIRPEAIFQFRFVLEPAAASMIAADHRWNAEEFEDIQTRLEAALHGFDFVTAAQCDMEFHRAVALLSGNEVFSSVVERYQSQVAYSLQLPFANPKSIRETADEHRAVIGAMTARDPAGARRAMQTHLVRAAARIGIRFFQP
ncbi:FadR/GntR family transcriptional regulator [Propionivibrio dicarboxylicus]|uniref:GntR family transcriptional regulator, transcriptional repressor for pyruvate dehydrogenase complex n=1 Tax=Propionivibrio dicarboxylicus TaxID=83767 RepID=A0A1G8JKY1_9RHOO|nr:FadR/GntR family transcriptional regulator [Propionivibrio dicarboxylicus]SDI31300.1 GntR family transcriptional regulator, transcriptional repressor for pyruvate dehydrogenase complex [Propionivibrio dicarboxylicus]